MTNVFSHEAFRRSLQRDFDLSAAIAELNKCLAQPRQVFEVYNGLDDDASHTPLFYILDADPRVQRKVDPKQLLQHPVLRQVIAMKWQNFGLRRYAEQLVMYMLLLLSMGLTTTESYAPTFIALEIALGLVYLACRGLRYPTRHCFALATAFVVALIVVTLPPALEAHASRAVLATGTHLVLLLSALYFAVFELNEMFAEVDPANRELDLGCKSPMLKKVLYYAIFCPISVVVQFVLLLCGASDAKYFAASDFNKMQLPAFVATCVVAGCALHGTHLTSLSLSLQLVLWVLSLQYFEVHAVLGVYVHLLKRMVRQVLAVLVLYVPCHIGLTLGYTQLFQHTNEVAYNSFAASSRSTYLVLFGHFDYGPFERLGSALGYALLLTHATIVLLLLGNMLVATMVSVIDQPLAQQEALVSLAECVLRSEKAAGLSRLEAMSVEDERRLLLSRVDSETYVAIAIEEGPSLHEHVASLRSELADARAMQAASQATLEQLVALVHAWKKDKST